MEVNAVEVDSLSKTFPPGDSQLARLRYVFQPGGRAISGVAALSGVSFGVARGEAFGIVGANGSGKSTLLKILAGILNPTSGVVRVHGRLSALLELGAGFAPDFTGRENVYLNASLLGLDRSETGERFATIESFASIGEFIEQPIRTYSTGMVLRLAFAVAAHVDPDVLIVDEALAVGDIAFRQRCMRRIHELRSRGTTILFVSHDAMDVKALCDRCLWLENGRTRAIGDADEVVANYLDVALHRQTSVTPVSAGPAAQLVKRRFGDQAAEVISFDLLDSAGEQLRMLAGGESVVVRVGVRANAQIESPIFGFLVRNAKGETIFGSNTSRENYPVRPLVPGDRSFAEFHWIAPQLAEGRYFISVGIAEGSTDDFEMRDYIEDAIEIQVRPGHFPVRGYMRLDCEAVMMRS
jgi:lipopolysaccharide transport system ATP-binding protein